MAEKGVQLESLNENKPLTDQQQQQGISIPPLAVAAAAKLSHQPQPKQEINNSVASDANKKRASPKLACRDLLTGDRGEYIKIGVPLYEASIKCDWKAAKVILDKNSKLVRYCITENGETPLHVAASAAKGGKHGEEFVTNLVGLMKEEDLTLENENFNTALYLAAMAGKLEMVKIMVGKNRTPLTIPGAGGKMMPLYAAALFGNYDVVKYMYDNSKELGDNGWTDENRGWLLEKCVENDMFDVALEIVKKYPKLGRGSVLAVLARKPEAFPETKPNLIRKIINLGKHLSSWIYKKHQSSQNEDQESGNGSVPAGNLAQKPEPSQNEDPEIGNGSVPAGDLAPKPEPSQINHPEIGNESVPAGDLSQKPEPFQIEHPEIGNGSVPAGDLAQISEPSPETKSNVIKTTIKSVSAFIGSCMGAHEKESKALPLLRIIWEDIAKMPKKDIDKLLRGHPDSLKNDKSASGRVVEAMQLQNLISEHKYNLLAGADKILKVRAADSDLIIASHLDKLISEQLVKIHVETQNISAGPPDSINQDNKSVSGNGDQVQQLQKLIFEHILKMHNETQKIIKNKEKEDKSRRLHKLIMDRVTHNHNETKKIIGVPAKETYSSRVLFIAAEMGNTTFLVELIRRYPDLIWKVNDNNQTIFHIAIKHRHAGIYNLLYEIGAMKDMITPLKDDHANNMLHLVGTSAKQKKLQDVSGVALQMQRELLWFEEVKNMIPPSYREKKNEDGLTPHELFTQEHKDLVTQGEEWMKGTASQCMVVAALIATIVFAAAFTIPGGYDQNSGLPMFRSKVTLIVFVVADAISLFTSSASILMFLSILTSRYAERDFLESLPKKLMLGLATLFLSITTMTVVFGISFFVLYRKGLLWVPILIGIFAVMPVLLYVKLQYSLFVDVISSTYGSRYLFKPTKHVLYYENPKM